jgi:hypothetical protein
MFFCRRVIKVVVVFFWNQYTRIHIIVCRDGVSYSLCKYTRFRINLLNKSSGQKNSSNVKIEAAYSFEMSVMFY